MSDETKRLAVAIFGFAAAMLAISIGTGMTAKYESEVKIEHIKLKIEACKQDKKWCDYDI